MQRLARRQCLAAVATHPDARRQRTFDSQAANATTAVASADGDTASGRRSGTGHLQGPSTSAGASAATINACDTGPDWPHTPASTAGHRPRRSTVRSASASSARATTGASSASGRSVSTATGRTAWSARARRRQPGSRPSRRARRISRLKSSARSSSADPVEPTSARAQSSKLIYAGRRHHQQQGLRRPAQQPQRPVRPGGGGRQRTVQDLPQLLGVVDDVRGVVRDRLTMKDPRKAGRTRYALRDPHVIDRSAGGCRPAASTDDRLQSATRLTAT